ncbi:GspE/PulE family protein [Longimicrobium sp.]|uniref:GspE/PulE family protein n=1 Tax=Longimicrobium sp. TaxID=2029185 RepID=UPI003B3AB2B4
MSGTGFAALAGLGETLTQAYLEENRLLPLGREDGRLVVAVCGRPDPQAVAELEVLFGAPAALRQVPEHELLEDIRRACARGDHTAAGLVADLESAGGAGDDGEGLAHDLEEMANQAPVVRLVNLLLAEAVESGASDVHLEAEARSMRVRYRIDGVLQQAPAPPPHLRSAVVSRLKIMAELDIAERRLPQDGRVRLRTAERELDVRVSTLPTLHGESVVLRLLDTEGQRIDLEGLGMGADTLATLLGFAARPHGVLLSTGPTGSGKTTTLYALLDRVRTGREKIVSVEDPVEYELAGVAQVPVNTRVGLTFARALRSILRQDPDVLLVGEMRDPETAEICIQAALTGHLVLSTLHTNDAPGALTRLVDLGVPDYLVASTVEGVMAQRLVRKVCAHCAREVAPDPAVAREMAEAGFARDRIRVGRGCARCRNTGYRGRTGLYELFTVDSAIRAELLRRPDADALRRVALERGMRPLRADGWRQVAAGLTTPDEVVRVS